MVQEMLIIQLAMHVIIQVHSHHRDGFAFPVQLEQYLRIILCHLVDVIHKPLVGILEFIHL
jgi:hypothetical protein